jgi:hypothetical protein
MPQPSPGLESDREPRYQIRFCAASRGVRIAYATVGQGPALIVPGVWIGHWEFRPVAARLGDRGVRQ